MNRYILVDLKNNCVSSLNKVDTNFEENDIQTSSVSCRDIEETKDVAFEYIYDNLTPFELTCRNELFDTMEDLINDELYGEKYANKIEKLITSKKDIEDLINKMLNDSDIREAFKEVTRYYLLKRIGEWK